MLTFRKKSNPTTLSAAESESETAQRAVSPPHPSCEADADAVNVVKVENAVQPAVNTKSKTTAAGKVERYFQKQWFTVYPRLRYDKRSENVFCLLCREVNKENTLSKEKDNFRTSSLTRHLATHNHQMAVAAPVAATDRRTAQTKCLI